MSGNRLPCSANGVHLVDVEGPARALAAEPLLLTARQAAALLSISERTLWDLTDQGKVPCVRIGRSVRYTRVGLVAYVERLRSGGNGKR